MHLRVMNHGGDAMPVRQMIGPTSDHEEIRLWATMTKARPAEVSPRVFDGQPAVLRFLFDKAPKDETDMHPISWESFFAMFDLMGLALVYDRNGSYELLKVEDRPREQFDGKYVS
jgi:hypothetical protein